MGRKFLRAFRNSYLAALVVLGSAAQAQVLKPVVGPGQIHEAIQIEKAFMLPGDTVKSTASNADTCRQLAKKNGVLYQYSCVEGKWMPVVSSIPGLDSARRSNDTLYFRTSDGDTIVIPTQLGFTSLQWHSPHADGITNDSAAFNAAIATGARRVFVPKGTYALSRASLRGNLEIYGEPGTVIRQLDASGYHQNGTFEYRRGDGSTDGNIMIRNIEFYNTSDNQLNYPIMFLVDTLSRVENITVDNCVFRNQISSCVVLLNRFQDYCGIRNVTVNNCKVYGDSTQPARSQLVNLVRGFANYPLNFSYGKTLYEDVKITNCYAEYVRTLSDMKRGGRGIIVTGNTARNLYDVAYSADGVFGLNISNNVSDFDTAWADNLTASGSQIEVQGERVVIANNIINVTKSNGILVSDYGYPEESGKGHNSRDVVVTGNNIRRAGDIGIKLVNVIGALVSSNYIEYAKTRSISIDSGNGYDDLLGNPLISKRVAVIGNRISDTSNIFVGADSSVIAKNFGTRLPATLNVSSASTWIDPSNAADYLELIKTVDGSGSGLDADLLDGRESNTFYGNSFTQFTDFNSATGNNVYDLSGFQPTNRPPAGNFFSLLNIDQSVTNNNRFQFAWQLGTQNVYLRNQSSGTRSGWNRLYHTGDFTTSTAAAASTVPVRDASGGIFQTGEAVAVLVTTGNITLDGSHNVVFISNSSHEITFPAAASNAGRKYTIINDNTGSAATLNGVAGITSIPDNAKWSFISTGSVWKVCND